MDTTTRSHRLPTVVLALIVPAIAVIAAVVTLNVTDEPGGGGASTDHGAAAGTTITIKNFEYAPPALNVAAGTTVKVVNADGTVHTVTATKGGFDTGDLQGGAQASITVSKPGRYTYFCDIHNYMTGVIEAS
ncbi:MAG: cupredoxin domain-containing protein [Acidimicrobiia bacterium]